MTLIDRDVLIKKLRDSGIPCIPDVNEIIMTQKEEKVPLSLKSVEVDFLSRTYTWSDGSKTEIRLQKGDKSDSYNAFCIAYAKRMLGSNSQIKREIANAEICFVRTDMESFAESCKELARHIIKFYNEAFKLIAKTAELIAGCVDGTAQALEKIWIKVSDELPPEGVLVETKIDDESGVRNFTLLTRKGNLYYLDNGTYTYYAPTHWRFYDGGDLKDE